MGRQFRFVSTWVNWCLVALLTTVTLGAQPYAYVGNYGTVSVLNLATNTVTASIFGIASSGIAVTPDGSTVYVSSSNYNNVAAISTSNNTVVATIPVGLTPRGLAVSPNGAVVYVVNYSSSTVSVISPATNTVTATIAVGIRPNAVAFSPDSTRAYITNYVSSSVSVIDTSSNAVVNTFATAGFPNGVAVTPDGTRLYVANQGSNVVTVHNTSGGVLATIAGFDAPNAVALANGKAFVTNGNGGSLSIIDTNSNSIVATVATGNLPTGVAITTDGTQALVANQYSNSVSQVSTSTNSLTRTVGNVGIYPTVVAMVPGAVSSGPAPAPPPPPPPQPGPGFSPIRMNAGGASLTDQFGRVWLADSGRNSIVTTASIGGTSIPALFQTEAFTSNPAGLTYTFPVPNGTYTVNLYFAETYETAWGRRYMNITVNGFNDNSIDVFARAGANTIYTWSHVVSVSNGQIAIAVAPTPNTGSTAMLGAIEIVQ